MWPHEAFMTWRSGAQALWREGREQPGRHACVPTPGPHVVLAWAVTSLVCNSLRWGLYHFTDSSLSEILVKATHFYRSRRDLLEGHLYKQPPAHPIQSTCLENPWVGGAVLRQNNKKNSLTMWNCLKVSGFSYSVVACNVLVNDWIGYFAIVYTGLEMIN